LLSDIGTPLKKIGPYVTGFSANLKLLNRKTLNRIRLWIILVKRILIGYFALKGLNVAAQGETLGNGNKKNMNPEGV